MLVSPGGTFTCPGSEVISLSSQVLTSHQPPLTSLPPVAHLAVAVLALSEACTEPCSQSRGHWLLSTVLAGIGYLAQIAPGPGDQMECHQLQMGLVAVSSQGRGECRGRHSQAEIGVPRRGRNLQGRVTGTPPAVVHTLREMRGNRVLKMLKSLTKKKKSLVGCEATRLSSSGSAFLIPEVTFKQGSVAYTFSEWSHTPTDTHNPPPPPPLGSHPQQTASLPAPSVFGQPHPLNLGISHL